RIRALWMSPAELRSTYGDRHPAWPGPVDDADSQPRDLRHVSRCVPDGCVSRRADRLRADLARGRRPATHPLRWRPSTPFARGSSTARSIWGLVEAEGSSRPRMTA